MDQTRQELCKKNDENDEEEYEHAENLYHEPAVRCDSLEILD